MDDVEIIERFKAIATPQFAMTFGDDSERAIKLSEHKTWLQSIRHEYPKPSMAYKVGVYIRYFNQTKHDNYLSYHKKQFADTIALCPKWTLVDFYVDNGATAPNMENAPEWSRLLNDTMDGKVDLIITQKASNVSKKVYEVTFCTRILARQNPPIGVYFISEDHFTLASYYRNDKSDNCFFPYDGWQLLPDNEEEARKMLESRKLIGMKENEND